VSRTLHAKDLSPLDETELTAEDREWLDDVQRRVRPSDHLLSLGDGPSSDDGDDFIVSRDVYGKWWAGRYIGDMSLGERRLEIRPRLGEVVIERWLGDVLNLVAVPETAARQHSASFIARLMGAVWCRSVAQASRHGPPAFRRGHVHRGLYVRGKLDVRSTVRLRATGSPHIASVESYRDLDNDVSRTLVAAERTLTSRIGHTLWRTPRVEEILPRLHEAVGARPRLPTRPALGRIRYTPITRAFKETAELSWSLAQLQGYTAASSEGKSEGLLVDVAELWELFVVKSMAQALPRLRVEHGTHAARSTWLLRSQRDQRSGLGRLKPDVLAHDGDSIRLVADAKYKRLQNDWPGRPQGHEREDLYQMTSYMARYSPHGEALGLLVYPNAGDDAYSTADAKGPWTFESGGELRFLRLSVEIEEARRELGELFAEVGLSQPDLRPPGIPA
jgi:5-methylcytosine-specific restriction enzyme subunit McrC